MNIMEQLRSITPQDFAQMGVQQVAYVRPSVVNGANVFTIHAADGTQIGIAPTRDIAFAAVKQHELEPVGVQ